MTPRPRFGLALGWAFALLVSCATLPAPEALTAARQREALPATQRAKALAPQAFAHARQLRERADAAYEAGDRAAAEILAEHSLAAFQRAVVQARLVGATRRIESSRTALETAESDLVQLTRAQQETEAEAKALELRVRVLRDAEPLEPIEPGSPAREAARHEAALSILEAARLLCLASRMLDGAEPGAELLGRLDELERELASRRTPTPIDRAMTLRADCLRALTATRRQARLAAPESDPADVLLVQLGQTLSEPSPVRDDRGVVLASGLVFKGRSTELAPEGSALVDRLAQVARANPAFPLLVVLHGPEDLAEARESALRSAFGRAGVTSLELRSVGGRIPSSVAVAKGTQPMASRVEFVFVSPQ